MTNTQKCAGCAELDQWEREARLAGDGSRYSDLVVLRRRHRRDVHGDVPKPAFRSSLLAGPFM